MGYGDFGANTNKELGVTILWMFFGVMFYTFVVGALTSAISAFASQQENLLSKMKALEEFAEESGLNSELHL